MIAQSVMMSLFAIVLAIVAIGCAAFAFIELRRGRRRL